MPAAFVNTLKSLGLGLGSIALASAILLLSDSRSQRRTDAKAPLRVAVLQHASQSIIDEGFAGMLAGLEEKGFAEGRNLALTRFNAEGDVATANAMAQEIVNGRFDLAISLTTLSLQALANANQAGKVRHVFGLVTDPVAAGVGIGKEPLDHPPHLVGIGSLQPVAESVAMARRLFPDLTRLGVVWNAAEINSEINTKLCRAACADLGITLLEANAENTSYVREGAVSLVARGADALWVGGDVMVLTAIDSVIAVARDAHIPVVTCIPGNAPKGALFDLGSNFFEVGRAVGQLAGKVLGGESPAKLPVEKIVPPSLQVNLLALKGLSAPWKFPPDAVSQADVVVDEQGTHDRAAAARAKAASATAPAPLTRKWRIRVLEYVNLTDVEDAEKGVLDALRESGLVEGRDYETRVTNAQGDIATLNGLVDAAVTDGADLIVTLSTPTLQTALRRAQSLPIVFTFLADPIAAGAGRGDTDHLPNVTGAYAAGDVDGMVSLIVRLLPNARRVGAMFCPAEINSVTNHDLLCAAAKKANLEMVSMGVNTPSEVADTALALCGKQIDVFCLPTANITAASFPSIVQATNRARVPTFVFLSGLLEQGATAVVARDYYDMGHAAGKLAVRVMRGEKPGDIPFQPATDSRLLLNRDAAKQCGVSFPEELLKKADRVIGN